MCKKIEVGFEVGFSNGITDRIPWLIFDDFPSKIMQRERGTKYSIQCFSSFNPVTSMPYFDRAVMEFVQLKTEAMSYKSNSYNNLRNDLSENRYRC
jgi:hypothetical protein